MLQRGQHSLPWLRLWARLLLLPFRLLQLSVALLPLPATRALLPGACCALLAGLLMPGSQLNKHLQRGWGRMREAVLPLATLLLVASPLLRQQWLPAS